MKTEESLDAEQNPVSEPVMGNIETECHADYLTVALAAYARHFPSTPVTPHTKIPALWRWNIHPTLNKSEILQNAKDFPHHNVGIVGRKGVGKLVFLDIDAPGVIEQIEGETGMKMPSTYAVCSRPQSARWKRHFYFYQTAYSVSKWRCDMNVKNVALADEEGKHPTKYDIKGAGRGGFVVGAGSVRDTGEVYTVIDDTVVIPIPDWLVDWILSDFRKWKSEEKQETNERKERILAAQQSIQDSYFTSAEKEGQLNSVEREIPIGGTYPFLVRRSRTLASLGFEKADIETLLVMQAVKFCEKGEEFCSSTKGKERIHRIAFDPSLVIGHATFDASCKAKSRKYSGLVFEPETSTPSDRSILTAVIGLFSDSISSTEAWDRFEAAFGEKGLSLNRRKPADQLAVSRAFRAMGFKFQPSARSWVRGGCRVD